MQLIGLTRAVGLTTLTFTLSATPTWSQTNQNSFKRTPVLYSQSQSELDRARTHIGRGQEFSRQKKWNLALAEFNRAIALDPNNAHGYSGKGFIYYRLGYISQATDNLTMAQQLYKEQGDAKLYGIVTQLLNNLEKYCRERSCRS